MIIQNTISSATNERMVEISASQQSKTTKKLSSGSTINRNDDAAELSISKSGLNHASETSNNIRENIISSESKVTDTIAAEEMVRASVNNINKNAKQAITAQANQTPEGVMSALQE